jgi:asparagine synthase (glutamine-hydrolysing)
VCGICGAVALDSATPVDPALVAAMNATMRHRGPDSQRMFTDGPAGLGACRLAIIDLPGGDQPLANEDATMHVVQNGEIYNYRELRERLLRAGHEFTTQGDTEVLVHLYEEHGLDFVEHLRGMFAIAIWDAPRRRLVLARDRFGIKPLYYGVRDGLLSFASELKTLTAQPRFEREIDLQALESYLAFNWIPGERSIYRDARRLPAGCLLVVDDGEASVHRYARPRPPRAEKVATASFDDAANAARQAISDSVKAHLVADVPVGVLLSGGVDSSILTALAATHSSGPIMTFSIGFEDRAFNELDRARLVAQRYGTDHHELLVRPDATELLPKLVETFDEPFGDSSALPTYIVAELAARHVKVALAGEGGDELYGGYYTYAADVLAARAGWAARAARPAFDRVGRIPIGDRREDRLRRFLEGVSLSPLERHCTWLEVLSADVRAELMGDRWPAADPFAVHRRRYAETAGSLPIARYQDVDVGTYLVDDLLFKTDRASMAHSLEVRVPFLDAAVAEHALSVPDSYRVRGLTKKRLLRAAARPLVPVEILEAPKQGFSIPAASWLRNELRDFAGDTLSPASLARHGYLSAPAVQRLLAEHWSGARDRSRQLWGLLMLSLWLDAQAQPAPAPVGGLAA